MKKFTEEKKKQFVELYNELDFIIDKIVKAKAEYSEYRFDFERCDILWEYDGCIFQIEAVEELYRGCETETHYLEITWYEIFDVNNIVKRLEKEGKERFKKKEEEKKIRDEKEKLRKEKAERENYERLKLKFETI